MGQESPGEKFLSEAKGLVPWTWWPQDKAGHTGELKGEVNALFGKDTSFDTPKPERLIERIIHIAANPGNLVLDSFLGSGTTAAVAHKMGRGQHISLFRAAAANQIQGLPSDQHTCAGHSPAVGERLLPHICQFCLSLLVKVGKIIHVFHNKLRQFLNVIKPKTRDIYVPNICICHYRSVAADIRGKSFS